ncbi:cystathionine beta-lyase/cystathionine gamma-synthase [Candidatus Methanoperedens nitroreducens]|uniref:Cystathionine beta-lyase/cystathionine gamma-synthase n=1 Tax=Candidatus Methanoperedens nitratireducens TaxID=1392998 RepID=A0A062UV76_9EURY|nr:PLP-dependent aspartate aminotransferase family protein [Candidatus Methanoperedens nitroreducens]KCZ70911.1 cystathionine beta-lyase/cystathionine gamma-synthase [Candidatus Methanoperedens nitroreducens]MDJ1421721.1 PLP-dependent aspartate aminotransferase family protein [Candidatus Methanoperedens sp.]
MDLKKAGFSTRAIHIGKKMDETGATATPIYQTAPFRFRNAAHAASVMGGQEKGYVYSRGLNPTTKVLEEKIANLEGCEAALSQASGMAAISAAVFSTVRAGDHVIVDEVIYGSTYDLFAGLTRFGVDVSFIDTSDTGNVETALRPGTKLVFFETPANPTNKLIDIKAVSDIAHDRGAVVFVDNTYMTPYFQQPLLYGADVVVHSATKYLNGHGDTLGGIVAGSSEFISLARRTSRDIGGAMSPFNAWLIIRGLKTLSIRMDRHNENAMAVAKFLQGHDRVDRVIYPGLKEHPQYDLAQKQMCGSGGMIAFLLKEAKDVHPFLDALKICTLAVSLGDAETLIQHPASMTHAVVPKENRIKCGIVDQLVRLSIGLENAGDIISDIEQALDRI